MPGPDSRVVCVLGMHRSGTSALTRVLGLLGVELGRDLLPASTDNPSGFWEQRELRGLHDRLLSALASSYDDIAPLPDAWWERDEVAPIEDEIVQVVSRAFRHAPLWGFKDPRACRLVPLWKRVLARTGDARRFVLVARHPGEIAGSLARRNGFSRSKSLLLTLRHVLASELDTRGERRVVVTYDQVLGDWSGTVDRLERTLDVRWPVSPAEAAREVARFLNPGLRHESAEKAPGPSPSGLAEASATVHEAMRRAAIDGGEPSATELDQVSDWLRLEWASFEPWRDTASASQRIVELEAWSREIVRQNEELRAENAVLSTGLAPRLDGTWTPPETAPSPAPPAAPQDVVPRVCIVTSELAGLDRSGDVGAWSATLARTLARAGQQVTVLFVPVDDGDLVAVREWIPRYASMGIRLVPLEASGAFPIDAPRWGRLSHAAFEWLRSRQDELDVVHVHEWRGHGLYALLAKRQGLAFASTLLSVVAHGPTSWLRSGSFELITRRDDLDADFMERESVRLADVVVSPSRYMVGWMRERGWRLPERVDVIPSVVDTARRDAASAETTSLPVEEVVFFGTLDERRGLLVFCEAVERLAAPARVTFLGAGGDVRGEDGRAFLRRRCGGWPVPPTLLDHLDTTQALDYLRGPGRLAVVPSLTDNLSYAVLECLAAGVPLLAADTGGTRELIPEGERARILFRPDRESLAARLTEVLRDGSSAPPPPPDVRDRWVDWHVAGAAAVRQTRPAGGPSSPPLVSVCLVHHDRPALLEHAVRSLEAQEYPNVEVVLVDDGSAEPGSRAFLDALEPRFSVRGWRIVRQPNRFVGAARNNAARHARGEYLLFMDDDNVAKPRQVGTFVRAATSGGAEILTSFVDAFSGPGPAPAEGVGDFRWLPLGGALASGFFVNLFGDAGCFVKRSTFLKLGGFTEEVGVVHEETELFARALLAGHTLEVVPDALLWYRVHPGGFLRRSSDFRNRMRGIRPYLEAVPEPLRDTLLYALGLHATSAAGRLALHEPTRAECQALVDLYWDSLSWRLTAPFRRLVRRTTGQGPERRPVVRDMREALAAIDEIQASASWEATGPLRAVRRALKLATRR